MQDLGSHLSFKHAFGVKLEGLSGGLVMFWNADLVVNLKLLSRDHVLKVLYRTREHVTLSGA